MTLVNDTFVLEPLKEEDAASLSKLMIRNGRRFQTFLPTTLALNLSETASKAYIEKKQSQMAEKDSFTFGIKDPKKKGIAGLVLMKEIDWETRDAELAYCIGKKYEGRGWVSESVKACVLFAFKELKLNQIHILIHKSNSPSIKVAENAGFKWSRTLYNEFNSTKLGSLDMELYIRKNSFWARKNTLN